MGVAEELFKVKCYNDVSVHFDAVWSRLTCFGIVSLSMQISELSLGANVSCYRAEFDVFRCRMSQSSCSTQPQVLVGCNFCSKPIAYDGIGAVGRFAGRTTSVSSPPPPLAKLKVMTYYCQSYCNNQQYNNVKKHN